MKPNNTSISVMAKADTSLVRHETFNGVDHLIVPIVALVEGVIHASNSPIPELAKADVFGQFPLAWNGRPVTLDHPESNGIKVSVAQSPSIFADEHLGFLFNSKIEDNKLKTEAWINLEKVKAAGSQVEEQIARLESGSLVEVSTGLFTEVELKEGEFNGQHFKGVWNSVMPDHLAILPEGTIGACSIEDGCGGPRVNQSKLENNSICECQKEPETNSVRATGVVQNHTHNFEDEDGFGQTSVANGHSHFFSLAERETEDTNGHKHPLPPIKVKLNNVNIKKEEPMNNEELVKGLISNEATNFIDTDAEWLSELSEENLVKLSPKEVDSFEDNAKNPEDEAKDPLSKDKKDKSKDKKQPEHNSVNKDEIRTEITVDSFIQTAPDEMQEVLNEGLRMHREQKESLIKGLSSNKRCVFSDDDLRAMDMSHLKKLSKLGETSSYEGQAGNVTANAGSDDGIIPEAPLAFAPK